MLLGPLAVAVVCVVADWAVWDWSISTDHGTVAVVAGLVMAPLVVAVAWYGARAVIAAVGLGLRWAADGIRSRAQRPARRPRTTPRPRVDRSAAADRPPERLAA